MSFSGNYRIAVSAGELSGDMHTAMVVQALRRFNPQAEVRGMGGGYLRGAGVNTVVDSERCAALQGLNIPWLVIRSLGAFLRMVKLLLFWRPHVLVVTDYPDFNLRLAKIAARFCGVPVLYYIPPKVWAWRSGRIKTMKKVIDRAALILPFEKSFYEQHGFEQTLFVGHPFAYTLDPAHLGDFSKDDFIKSLGLDPLKPVVALFPGSRSGEIKRHLKRVIAGLECLRTSRPNIQVIVAVAAGIKSNVISAEIGDREWIKVSNGNNLEIMRCATAGLLKSGTCNLEAAFLGLPFVCFYIPPRLTEKIVRALATIKFSSLVNLIKADAVVELIQDHASPSRIATELEKVMFDQECRRRVLADLKAVTAELSTHDQYPAFDGCKNAAERTAKLTLELAEKGGLRHNLKRSLKAFLKPYRYQFFGALGCMLLFGASDGLVPFLVKHVLDDVFKNHDRRM
ncbi:MAG: lipid-A-disaccharide synthase, partial [Deltaproteobacteria bacterium]|nr:lipid-A-disaccharide synthase [Deltaproteobacteria bacterium]